MADQHRDYEDYRRGGRREWTERRSDERPNWSDERSLANQSRRWRSQGDGDSYTDDGYTFGPGESSGYGRESEFAGGRGYSSERGFASERGGYPGDRSFFGPRHQAFGQSFGGQRPYARDLYSDSSTSRHETDWQSGSAGRGMQNANSPTGAGTWSGRQGYGGGFRGRGPKDYQRSDERIREEISDRMTDDDNLDASDITIQVKQGEVALIGTVTTRDQKRRAEDLAESISGVREVTNNIRVAREQGLDLNQSPSIQVNQPGQSGSRTGSKSGSGSTASS